MEAQTMVMSSSAFSNLSDAVTAITTQSITALDTGSYSDNAEAADTNPYNLVTTNEDLSVQTVTLNVAEVFGDEANALMNTRQLHFIQHSDGSLHPIFNNENLVANEQEADEAVTFDSLQTIRSSDYESRNSSVIQADSTSEDTLPVHTQEAGNDTILNSEIGNGTSENLAEELMSSEESRHSESREASLQANNQDEGNSNTVVIDVSNPIHLSQNSLIVVNGKRCVLQQDLESGQLLAYPIKEAENPPKRRPGRPRRHNAQIGVAKPQKKVKKGSASRQASQAPVPPTLMYKVENGEEIVVEADTSTGETGFIEKANEEGEIVKRSARKRKKTALLADYETNTLKFQCSSDEEYSRDQDDGDEIVPAKQGRGMKKGGKAAVKKAPTISTSTNHQKIKRARGRPRRYGLKPPEQPPTQTFLVHTADGQAVLIKVPLSSLSPGKSLQSSAQDIADCLNARIAQKPILPLAPKLMNDGTPNNEVHESKVMLPLSSSIENQTVEELHTAKQESQSFDKSALEQNLQRFENEVQVTEDKSGTESEHVELNHQAAANIEKRNPLVVNEQEEENLIYPISVIMTDNEPPVKIGLKATENDLEKMKCSKCDYQAYYQNQYQEHIALHQEDVQQCKCCDYLSFTQEDLLEHYNEQHPKCICQICNHTAAHPYVMKRHMYKHSEMTATCDICGKTYRDHYILKMHIRNVHMPAEEFFECPVCDKKFTRKAHLKRHIRTHDPNKPYKCDQCEYRGSERSDITKHKLIHEEPKYVCEVCNRTFRHIKNMELHVKRHNGQRDYKCGVCEFYGYTFTDIRKHIERKHTDSKTILCSKCGQAFKTEQELKEHQDSDQCELFMLEQALQDPEHLEDSSQLEDDLIGEEESDLIDATESQDPKGITSITLTDESIATLRAIQGITGHIVVSSDLGEITTSQLLNSVSDASLLDNHELKTSPLTLIENQSRLGGEPLTILTDNGGNKHFAMVAEHGQMLSGAFMEGDTIPTYIENDASIVSQIYEVDSNMG